jgi:hypothetical protein
MPIAFKFLETLPQRYSILVTGALAKISATVASPTTFSATGRFGRVTFRERVYILTRLCLIPIWV